MRVSRALSAGAIAVVSAAIIVRGLGNASLSNWDEAIYAQIAREFLATGDWLTPHWQYREWFEKPPLLMWLTAGVYVVLGVNEFAARLVSAISGVATVVVAWALAMRLYGLAVAWMAAAILLTSFAFLRFARLGMTDALLTLCLTAALYGYVRLLEGRATWWYLLAASCASALMVKSVAGLVFLVVVAVGLAVDRRALSTLPSRSFWISLGVLVVLVAPWHLAMVVKHGWRFLDEYIGYHVIQRATRALEDHEVSGYLYFAGLWNGFYPWLLLLPIALARAFRDAVNRGSNSRILVVSVTVILAVYFVVRTKLPWYILPAYPPLAILLAAALQAAIRDRDRLALGALAMGAAVAAILAPWKILAAAAAVAFVAGLICLSMTTARRSVAAVTGAFLLVVAALGQLRPHHQSLLGGDQDHTEPLYAGRYSAVARIARLANGSSADRAPLILLPAPPLESPEVIFYSDRPVEERHRAEELTADLHRHPFVHLLATREAFEDVARLYAVDVIISHGGLVYAVTRAR